MSISDAIVVSHTKSGAKALVHPVGATVISFVTASGRELLYTSPDAIYDGSKAIRGGVPIVFPQCRRPDPAIPNHGFMRINQWRKGDFFLQDDEKAVQEFHLSLQDVTKGRGAAWDHDTKFDFDAVYRVQVEAEAFTTTLIIENTSKEPFPFQTLLHTYYRVADGLATNQRECFVKGLHGYKRVNQDTNEEELKYADDQFHLDGHTDSIFYSTKEKLELDVKTGNGTGFTMVATGTVNGYPVPVNVCIWNPHIEESQSLKDFPNMGYHDMIGVEPGLLEGLPALQSGQKLIFTVRSASSE